MIVDFGMKVASPFFIFYMEEMGASSLFLGPETTKDASSRLG